MTTNTSSMTMNSFMSYAKRAMDELPDVAKTLGRDLRELGAHVAGASIARRDDDDDDGDDDDDDEKDDDQALLDDDRWRSSSEDEGPSAGDARRLAESVAESFASNAWAALGGAARGARKVLEKAEGAIENAASDPRAFATNVTGKAQALSGTAFHALVKLTTDALTGAERDGAEEILIEKLADYGADAHRLNIEDAYERAKESLLAGSSEETQSSVRVAVRRVDGVMSGAGNDSSFSPPRATLIAVPLDGDDAGVNVSADILASLIERFDVCAQETTATLVALARKLVAPPGTTRIPSSKRVAMISALEDGLDDLRDDYVCRGLAELTTVVLARVDGFAASIENRDAEWTDGDAESIASQVSSRLRGMDDDIKVLVEAAKETTMNIARSIDAELGDSWRRRDDTPDDVPSLEDVARVAVDQLTRDENMILNMMVDTRRQLAWIIAANSNIA